MERIASALLRAGGERDPPKRIRLAENVGAALLSSAKIQKTQSAWPHDGKGQQVIERRVENEEPPNWFRPSYRMRPRRAWFHLRAGSFGRIDDADKAVLIFERALLALLVLLQPAEGDDAGAETQPDQLMPATDAQHRSPSGANQAGKVIE